MPPVPQRLKQPQELKPQLDFATVTARLSRTRQICSEQTRAAAAALHRLVFVNEVCAAILLPAPLVRFGAEWLLFPVADGFDAIATNPSLDERILDGVGTVRA